MIISDVVQPNLGQGHHSHALQIRQMSLLRFISSAFNLAQVSKINHSNRI